MSSTHLCLVEHRGSFAHAVCSCGWRGPGRRSIGRALVDGQTHDALGEAEEVLDLTTYEAPTASAPPPVESSTPAPGLVLQQRARARRVISLRR